MNLLLSLNTNHEILINKREGAVIMHFNDSETYIEYQNLLFLSHSLTFSGKKFQNKFYTLFHYKNFK